MMNKHLLRIQWRTLKFDLIERAADVWNVFLPVFFMSGLLVACFKFWLWVMM